MSQARTAPAFRGAVNARLSEPLGLVWSARSADPDGSFSILIVEDDRSQREILCYNLESDGYEVLIAENGEEALLVVDEASPNIILLDWMMPLVSGIEV